MPAGVLARGNISRPAKFSGCKIRQSPQKCEQTMVGNEASFRVAAAECVEAAVKSTDPDAAAKLLQMAQNWLDLAEERELKPLGPPYQH